MSAIAMAPLALSPASAQIFGFGLGAPALNQSQQQAQQPAQAPQQPQAATAQAAAPAASAEQPRRHSRVNAHRAARAAAPAEAAERQERTAAVASHSRRAHPAARQTFASAPALKRTWKHRALATAGNGASEGSSPVAGGTFSSDDKPVPGDKTYSFKETRQWIARSAR